MIELNANYVPLMLEAVQELLYKISLQMEEFKGQPMNEQRKALSQKQADLEQLQHLLYAARNK